MAKPIIAALRQRRDLKESVLHTAQELAHRASIYGVVPATAYSYLAQKAHCSPRTAIRHVQRLEAAKILQPIRCKRIVRRKDLPASDRGYSADPRRGHERVIRNEVNQYRFVIPWDTSPQRPKSSSRPYDRTAQNLLPPEREKTTSVREELEHQRKALREGWITPGSERWEAVNEKIVYLERLLMSEPAAVALA